MEMKMVLELVVQIKLDLRRKSSRLLIIFGSH